MSKDPSQKLTIRLHQLGYLPHYFPLYCALYRLMERSGSALNIEVQTATDGKQLFGAVMSNIEQERNGPSQIPVLNLLLAGQIESFFNDKGFEPTINEFVSARILIQQAPLWIYARGSFTGTLYPPGSSPKSRVLLPPKDTTLSLAFRSEFGNRDNKFDIEHLAHTDIHPSTFNRFLAACTPDTLLSLLDEYQCDAVATLFPVQPSMEKSLMRLNELAPQEGTGFTSIWIPTDVIFDDRFRKFQDINRELHDVLHCLHNCEPHIVEQHDAEEYISIIKQRLASEPKLCGGLTTILERIGEHKLLKSIPWHTDNDMGYRFLAELIVQRIWDFDFLVARDAKYLENNSSEADTYYLYHRSLTAYLQRMQFKRFKDPITADIRDALEHVHSLGKLNDILRRVNVKLQGSEGESQFEGALAKASIQLHDELFRDDLHNAANCILNRARFRDQLLSVIGKSKWREDLLAGLQSLSFENKSLTSFMDALAKVNQLNWTPTDEMIYSLKCVARGEMPITWLSDECTDHEAALTHGLNLPELEKRSSCGISRVVLMRVTNRPKGEWQRPAMFEESGRWYLNCKIEAKSGRDLSRLGEAIVSTIVAQAGDSTDLIYWMRMWGFKMPRVFIDSHRISFHAELPTSIVP